MSLDVIVKRSKMLEARLKALGYRGKGLHELVSQAGQALDQDVVRACRTVATIRNKAVHEEDFRLSGAALQRFVAAADFATGRLAALHAVAPERGPAGLHGWARAPSAGVARPAERKAVFGKRVRPVPPARAGTPLMPYLVAAGLAVGATGLWVWLGAGS